MRGYFPPIRSSQFPLALFGIVLAARQVAGGDFSVYVPPIHSPDKRDYMDDMILDFNKMVAECALLFEDLWEAKGIEFAADIEDQAVIDADESLLELVWNNLLSNAVKFTGPGGGVTLRQISTAEGVEVSVSDTGCGMDAGTLEHIFDKDEVGSSNLPSSSKNPPKSKGFGGFL